MKAAFAWFSICVFLIACCSAQQASRTEIFGGYSLEHISACGAPGDTFLTCSQFIETGTSKPANYNGWEASLKVPVYKFVAVTADLSGHYGTTVIQGNGLPSASVSRVSYMFGPTASLRKERFALFAHALFGGMTNKFGTFGSGEDTATVPTYTVFASALGGGVDLNMVSRWAVRIGQFDFERVGVPSAGPGSYPGVNGFRFASGIVFKP
ncbi:MAG TPA: hypothetical protein VMX38_11210 [Verrucomicrobiae bacterium]|nr:hypothetical protein [Verrucomicrobiae bacterium]